MKKIIDGKKYDTSTAKLVAEYYSDYGKRDCRYYEEHLYQKRTGEFFIYGLGSADSPYKHAVPDGWDGGEKIIPLSWEAARQWAESHLSDGEYEAVFGDVDEDDGRSSVNLSLSNTAIEKAKRAAAQTGASLSAYIESLIQA